MISTFLTKKFIKNNIFEIFFLSFLTLLFIMFFSDYKKHYLSVEILPTIL